MKSNLHFVYPGKGKKKINKIKHHSTLVLYYSTEGSLKGGIKARVRLYFGGSC